MKRHGSMNHVFRLVWSQVLNGWVAVAETSGGRGKSASRKLSLTALSLSFAAFAAQAAPGGGKVVSGAASIGQSGTTTTIVQSSPNLALNWNSFNISAQETVNFVQPGAASVAVNRIADTGGTRIFGRLNANGQVFLINPNGVLFGQGAQVNVGGLVASTLDLKDSAGASKTFSGAGTGAVLNQGAITAADGGYVALLGNTVGNQGVITARLGAVALAAGSAATLTFNGSSLVAMQVEQSTLDNLAANGGLIRADGGLVAISAGARESLLASVVNNTGVIEARTVEQHGGVITLLGGMAAGTVKVGGTLDASAPVSGNGGFIETSAARVDVADSAKISSAARTGATGSWLIDPADFTVAASGGNITGAALGASLKANNVTIFSSAGKGEGNGDVNLNDVVTWSARKLTLNAERNININASLNASGSASLALEYGQGAAAEGNTGTYLVRAAVNLPAGKSFSTKLGSDGATTSYTVLTSLGAANSKSGTDLQGINGNLSGNYVLGADIEAKASANWNGGAGFTPIGNGETAFTGNFDGLGHSIGNLGIKLNSSSYVGLFARAGAGSRIANLGLTGGSVSGGYFVGALAGYLDGTLLLNNYASTSVSGTAYVGGLVGFNVGAIDNSYASGAVSGQSLVGGLVGFNVSSGAIRQTYASGAVKGGDASGGLVGRNDALLEDSFWNTQTTGQTGSSGGVGMATAQMQKQANFTSPTSANAMSGAAWDFEQTWVMYEGRTAPLLRSFMTDVSVTANNAVKTYDGKTYAGGAGVLSPGADSKNLLGTLTYGGSAQQARNVGEYVITAGGLYSNQQGYIIHFGSGTLTVNPASLAVTGVSAVNKVYDAGLAAALGGTAVVKAFAGDTVSVGGSGVGAFADKNVGSGKAVSASGFTLSGADAANYQIVQPTGLKANISAASLAIEGLGVAGKVYDAGTAATLSGSASVNALGQDSVSVSGVGKAVFADKNAGEAKAVLVSGYTLKGADAGNYVVVQPSSLTADISAVNIGLSGVSVNNKIYDGGTGAKLTGKAGVKALGKDSLSIAGSGVAVFLDKNAGSGKAVDISGYTLSGKDAGNYVLLQSSGMKANIGAASLAVSGVAADAKVYDGSRAATLSGSAVVTALAGDSVSVGGAGSALFADKNAGTGKAVVVSGYTLSGADAGNYAIVQPLGLKASISAASLQVSGVSALDKVYDATLAATLGGSAQVAGFVGDIVSVAGKGKGAFADKNVGSDKTVSVSGFTLAGKDALNYRIVQPTGLTADITPKALAVTGVAAAAKVYDAGLAAVLGGKAGVKALGGDSVILGGRGVGTFADKNVGTGKAVSVTGFVLDGRDAANYSIVQPLGLKANISVASLTLAGIGALNKVYDNTTVATLAGTATVTPLADDSVSVGGLGKGVFANKTIGVGKAVTISGFTLLGADAANYRLLMPANVKANISAAGAP